MAGQRGDRTAKLTIHLFTDPMLDQGKPGHVWIWGQIGVNENRLHGTNAAGRMLNANDFQRYFTPEGIEMVKDLLRQAGWVTVVKDPLSGTGWRVEPVSAPSGPVVVPAGHP